MSCAASQRHAPCSLCRRIEPAANRRRRGCMRREFLVASPTAILSREGKGDGVAVNKSVRAADLLRCTWPFNRRESRRADPHRRGAAVFRWRRALRPAGQARARPRRQGYQRGGRNPRPAGQGHLCRRQDAAGIRRERRAHADRKRRRFGACRPDHVGKPQCDRAGRRKPENAAALRHQLRRRQMQPLCLLVLDRAEPGAGPVAALHDRDFWQNLFPARSRPGLAAPDVRYRAAAA